MKFRDEVTLTKREALDVLGALATALHLAQDAGDLAAEFEIDGALRILEDELAT